MTNQKYDQFRTFLTTEAREVLFVKQEPEIWDHYFGEIGPCPEGHVRVFHLTGFMTESAIVVLTTVVDRKLREALPTIDLSQLPVKPSVWLGCPEGLDLAISDWFDQLNKCLVYPSEEQRALDKDRVLSHFWAGLQVHGRVSVVL